MGYGWMDGWMEGDGEEVEVEGDSAGAGGGERRSRRKGVGSLGELSGIGRG